MLRSLFPIILLIVSGVTFYMVIDPQYKTSQALQTEKKDVELALSQARELQSELDRLLTKVNSFSSEDMEKLQKMLPNNVDNIRLFLDMQNIASKYGITMSQIGVGDQPGAKKETVQQGLGPSEELHEKIVLTFSVNSSYENLLLFLKDLEKSLRIVEIKSLAFTSDAKSGLYKVSIGINTFWLKGDTIAPVTASN